MLLKAVAFDLDNTLASIPRHRWLQYPSSLPKMIALQKSSAYLRGFRQHPLHDAIEKELQKRLSSTQSLEELDRVAASLYRKASIPVKIRSLMQACDQHNIPRAVLSDHPAIEKLKALALDEGWACVLTARSYGALKPLPDSLYALCAQLGIHPSSLLYIGDRYDTDEQACIRIGCRFVNVMDIDIAQIVDRFSY